jgi:hypothetical protein
MRTSNVLAMLALTILGASPLACFYPDYTFDETGSGGSGASGNPSSGPSSGGSGAVGGGGAGVGGNLGEVCGNGVDDDDDEQVDCADGECTDFMCTPPVPTDWTGYFALFDGPGPDPGCPATFPGGAGTEYIGNASLQAPPAECSACTCSAPMNQTCVNPEGVIIQDAICGGSVNCSSEPPGLPLPPANNVCSVVGVFSDNATTCGPDANATCTTGTGACNVSAKVDAADASGGTCTPQGGVATKPGISWERIGHACGNPALTGAGCNGNQICLPKAGGDFEAGVCIMRAGIEPCPPGSFTEQHVFHEATTDDRDCSECACGAPVGGACPTTVQLYSDNDCINLVATIAAGDCEDIPGNPEIRGRKLAPLGAPAGASCTASGGDATGGVEPITATTFCCTP